jgi:hypothetical protein
MIQDTAYNLEVHLQWIDKKMERVNIDSTRTSDSTIGLSLEQQTLIRCLIEVLYLNTADDSGSTVRFAVSDICFA